MKVKDNLCCCEYINHHNERTHILECCCNCEDLDLCVDRLLRCRKVPVSQLRAVMATVHDRLRVPWLRGARPLLHEIILPPFALTIIGVLAAQGPWWTTITLCSLPLVGRLMLHRVAPRYFVAWTISSVILPAVVFDIFVIPMLEILPLEMLVLCLLTGASLVLLRLVWVRSRSNLTVPSLPIDGTGVACAACRRTVPSNARHCNYCRICSVGMLHHCIWLDCCIGECNRRPFIAALALSFAALVYGSILIFTSVCRPFFWLGVILLPYDCSDVYHDFHIAVCFVCAVYTGIMALCLLPVLLQHTLMLARDSCSRLRSLPSYNYHMTLA